MHDGERSCRRGDRIPRPLRGAELHSRGHLVRAVARDRDRACREGPWGSPSLDGLVDEWALGNVTDPRFTRDLAADVEHVVSTLG